MLDKLKYALAKSGSRKEAKNLSAFRGSARIKVAFLLLQKLDYQKQKILLLEKQEK